MVFNPMGLFLTMNDKKLDWKKIRKMFPAKVKRSGYGARAHDDARKIVEAANGPRNKAHSFTCFNRMQNWCCSSRLIIKQKIS